MNNIIIEFAGVMIVFFVIIYIVLGANIFYGKTTVKNIIIQFKKTKNGKNVLNKIADGFKNPDIGQITGGKKNILRILTSFIFSLLFSLLLIL